MEIKITRIPGRGWCVEMGEHFASWLGWDEMLGTVAMLTLNMNHNFLRENHCGLRTYEQKQWGFRDDNGPLALITHQPELTPFIDEDASPFRRIF